MATYCTFHLTVLPFSSRLTLNTNLPSITVQPLALLHGTRLKTSRSRMEASTSWQAATHFGASGDAMASLYVVGSSGLLTLVDNPHSNPLVYNCSWLWAVWDSIRSSIA